MLYFSFSIRVTEVSFFFLSWQQVDQWILLHLRTLESVIYTPIQKVAMCASICFRKPPTLEKKKPATALVFRKKPQAQCQKRGFKELFYYYWLFFRSTVQNFALTLWILLDPAEWKMKYARASQECGGYSGFHVTMMIPSFGFFLICIKISYFRDATFRGTLIAFGPMENYNGKKNGCVARKSTMALSWAKPFLGCLVICCVLFAGSQNTIQIQTTTTNNK